MNEPCARPAGRAALSARALLLLLVALAVGSCRLGTRGLDPVRYYDFGVPEPAIANTCCARQVELDPVAYAPMLAGQTMWYREGTASVQPQAFAISRWSAEPAALLEQHLRVALGIGPSDPRAPLPYQLSLKLETMEQLFAEDGHSEARLTVSATLTEQLDNVLLDSRVLALNEQVGERSPAGGARAMASLVRQLSEALQSWICGSLLDATDAGAIAPGGSCPDPEAAYQRDQTGTTPAGSGEAPPTSAP